MNRLLTLIAGIALISSAATADVRAEDKTTVKEKTEVKTTETVAPDNTAKNVRDSKNKTLTPEDQSNEKTDVAVTAKIRKGIMAKKGYSVDAQNVKIITKDGVVTLRGPVDSEKEKGSVAAVARKYSGSYKVVNELEVKTKG